MEPLVETSGGKVRGVAAAAGDGRTVHVYRGIPYAAPPVGRLRFRSPQPASPWSGVLDASAFGPSPVQSNSNLYGGGLPGNRVGPADEDCLTLNWWTPARPAPAGGWPVMFWVFGGAYLTGGSSIETYDAAELVARHDVIVVSANYRMGAFGFMWLAESDGEPNCGLRDQLAALEWVRANAAAFGGDPANVTAFGESAGAGSLLHLLSSRHAEGVVRRAILQSPGVDHTITADHAATVTAAVCDQLGLKPADADRLRQLPWEAVLDAQESALLELMGRVSSMPFHPVVDGSFLAEKPSVAFASGAAAATDLLVSWTADEMRLYPNRTADEGTDRIVKLATRLVRRRLGGDAEPERIRQLVGFYEEHTPGSGADVWAALQTDGIMRLPPRRIADAHAAGAGAAPTFASEFAWSGKGKEWDRGAFHAIDLPFTFATLDRAGWLDYLNAGADAGGDRGAHAVALAHMAAWAAFAWGGDPAGALPGWARYDEQRLVMRIDDECEILHDHLADAAAAWDGLWSPDGGPPA